MKWKIIKLETIKDDVRWGCFYCENEEGKREWLDLFTNSSYKGFKNITRASKDWEKKYKSLIGKTVEVDSIFPYQPLYFAKNIKLLTNTNNK